ncbi:ParB/RepB/Spo0J family partition protein [Oscillibacter ruminantium]|uniref:ParB/RepB/Spo0J family partition protein n=1 Tax=Oscillibacter ruminantium TaxID=1263547 RepID=UPI0003130F10|nr:ParB N-terminal domain-containing protein [Oscillibacter ruminantium]
MAKAKFDMGEFAKTLKTDVPELDTSGREQIRYIDIDLIDDDPNNFYAVDGLDELAANIELCGLQQPIRVRSGESGRYTIVSGHRRRAALRKLVEDGQSKYREVPCIEERDGDVSPAMRELRLIYANADTRRLSSADIAKQAERVEALLYQLKEEGVEFPGRMRDHVAEACKVSKSKLARLKMIRKHLITLWSELYAQSEIAEDTAYELAQQPEDYQLKLYQLRDGTYGVYASTIKEYAPALASLDAIKCPNGEQCCTNADNMWSRMLKRDYCTKHCDGRYGRKAQCCKGCPELSKCKYACPAFADEIAKEKAEAKAERQEEKAAKEAAQQAHIASVVASWARVGAARKAAKLKMNDFIRGIYVPNKPESASYSDWREKEWANREKGEGITLSDRCFGADILNNDELIRAADILGCSLDYLLGRVDDPQPFTGAWKSAREEKPDEGRFLFVCDAFGYVQSSVYWNGDYMDSTPRSTANEHLDFIHFWMYQPAMPEGMRHGGQDTLEEIMKERGMDV